MVGMTALLERASKAGLTVSVDSGTLHVEGPRAAEAIALELLARKPEVLAFLAPHRAPSWESVRELRWGPAVGDPEPGLVVDRPSPRPGSPPTRSKGDPQP